MEYQPVAKPKGREGVLLSQSHIAKPRTPSSKKLYDTRADKCSNRKGTKFVGVRQRPSGKWVAEIKDTTQKIRMWLGTFETAEEAARAYDEAALLLRGSNTRTNFADTDQYRAANSLISTKIRNLLDHKICLKRNFPRSNSSSLGNGNISIAAAQAFKVNLSNSSSSVSTTTSTGIDKSLESTTDQDTLLFKKEERNNNVTSSSSDEGYRPDLSSCIVEQGRATTLGISQRFSGSSWPFPTGLEEQVPAIATSIQQGLLSWDDFKADDKTEFEPIIEETRMSASMYEVNGFMGSGCETGYHVDAIWGDFSKHYCPPCTFFLN